MHCEYKGAVTENIISVSVFVLFLSFWVKNLEKRSTKFQMDPLMLTIHFLTHSMDETSFINANKHLNS